MKFRTILATAIMLVSGFMVYGQQDQIAKFLPAYAVNSTADGQNNLNQLIGGYISPIAEDFGTLSNNGWYNTAETHQKFGFDISVTMNTVFPSSDKKTFTPTNLRGLTFNGSIISGNKAPTAYGQAGDFPLFAYNELTNPNTAVPNSFRGPDGGSISDDIPVGALAIPTLQAAVGLMWNTDVKFRYTPNFTIFGTEFTNWGVGFKHDIKQHIPGLKMVPIGLSVMFAYSKLTATTDLSGFYSGTGQKGIGETSGYTIQALISKQIPVLTFYGGVGYNSSTTRYQMQGTYVVDKTGDNVPLASARTITNPFTQDFNASGFRATGGLRFKFGPIFLSGDYTYVNSKGLFTLGFGVTVR